MAAVIGAVILASLVFAVGVAQSQLWLHIPWSPSAGIRLATIAGTVVLLSLLLLLPRFRPQVRSTGILLALAGLAGLAGPASTLVALLCLCSLVSTGGILCRLLGWDREEGASPAFHLVAGLAVWIIALYPIIHLPINIPLVHLLLWSLPIVAERGRSLQESAGWARDWCRRPATSGLAAWLGPLIVLLLIVQGIAVLLPDVAYDSNAIYIPLMQDLARTGVWRPDPANHSTDLLPMGGIWVFSSTAMLGSEMAARIVNGAFLLAGCAVVSAFVNRISGRTISRLCVCLWLTTPLALSATTHLYQEQTLTLLVLAGVLAALWRRHGDSLPTLVPALILSAAIGTKLTASFIVAPVILIGLYLQFRRHGTRPTITLAGIWMLALLVAASPPYVVAWLLAGNPVFPFMNQVFRSPYFSSEPFKAPFTGLGSWNLLYQMSFYSDRFLEASRGAMGFQHLLLVPAIVAALAFHPRRRFAILFTVALGFGVTVCLFTQNIRYLMPAMPLVVVLIPVLFLPRSSAVAGWNSFMFCVVGVVIAANLVFLSSSSWIMRDLPLQYCWSESKRIEYRDLLMPERAASRALSALLTTPARVAFVCCQHPFSGDLAAEHLYHTWYHPRFSGALGKAQDPDAMEEAFEQWGITHVLVHQDSPMINERVLVPFLAKATSRVLTRGAVEVRTYVGLPAEERPELLANPDFSQGWSKWDRSGDPQRGSATMAGITVDNLNFIHQRVWSQAFPRRCRFQATIAQPARPSRLVLQANWLSEGDAILGADCDIPACREAGSYSMDARPRPGAKAVVVYIRTLDATDPPLRLQAISLR